MEKTIKQQLANFVRSEDLVFTSARLAISSSGELKLKIGFDSITKTVEAEALLSALVDNKSFNTQDGKWGVVFVTGLIKLADPLTESRKLYSAMSLILGSGIAAPISLNDYTDDLSDAGMFNLGSYEDNSIVSCSFGSKNPDDIILLIQPEMDEEIPSGSNGFLANDNYLHLKIGSSYEDFITILKQLIDVFI